MWAASGGARDLPTVIRRSQSSGHDDGRIQPRSGTLIFAGSSRRPLSGRPTWILDRTRRSAVELPVHAALAGADPGWERLVEHEPLRSAPFAAGSAWSARTNSASSGSPAWASAPPIETRIGKRPAPRARSCAADVEHRLGLRVSPRQGERAMTGAPPGPRVSRSPAGRRNRVSPESYPLSGGATRRPRGSRPFAMCRHAPGRWRTGCSRRRRGRLRAPRARRAGSCRTRRPG